VTRGELVGIERLGAVDGECEEVRGAVGVFGHLICWHGHERTVGRLLGESARRCGVLRHGRWYSLWHVFLRIVLKNGTEIRTLLELRGQNDVSSRMIYRHVLNRSGVGYAAFLQNAGLGRGGTQSVALGWYSVSRWDTGWGCEGLGRRGGLVGGEREYGASRSRGLLGGRVGALRAQGEL
jgi:hypothetical protein